MLKKILILMMLILISSINVYSSELNAESQYQTPIGVEEGGIFSVPFTVTPKESGVHKFRIFFKDLVIDDYIEFDGEEGVEYNDKLNLEMPLGVSGNQIYIIKISSPSSTSDSENSVMVTEKVDSTESPELEVENNECNAIGIREYKNDNNYYCNKDFKLILQKSDNSICQNDFECISNSCSSGKCDNIIKNIEEQKGILESILNWLKNLFSF
jgi:hypothetical protein